MSKTTSETIPSTQANPQPSPLSTIRVAITRAVHQAKKQGHLLEEAGAEVVYYPCIDIVPPLDTTALDQALTDATTGQFDWLVLTSINTITSIAARLQALELAPSALAKLKIATIGAVTAQAVEEQLGLSVELVPERYVAEALAETMAVQPQDRILLPQSAIARPALAASFKAAEAALTTVEAYRNVIGRGGDNVPLMLWEGKIDAITFTSESTVRFFAKRIKHERGTLNMLDDVCVACIGPVTTAAAKRLGLRVSIQPKEHTIEKLVEAVVDHFTAS